MQCGVACLASICEYYGKELWKAIFAHNSFYFYVPHQLQLDIIKMQDITDVVRILRNFSHPYSSSLFLNFKFREIKE